MIMMSGNKKTWRNYAFREQILNILYIHYLEQYPWQPQLESRLMSLRILAERLK
jgi:hypothetical protein